MKKTLGKKFWLTLVIFSLTGQIAWVVENMYFNVFMYKMFHASAADLSAMVGASAVAAAVTTLLIGALSDKVGHRKLFISGGYIAWGISILAFALLRMDILTPIAGSTAAAASLGVTLVILMDCVMTFFGSSANDACFNAWLTDCGESDTRGRIEGINSMMPLLAILVVFGGFMPFDLDKASSWGTIYTIIGVLVIAIGIAGFFLIDEQFTPTAATAHYWKNVLYSFRPSVIRANPFLYAVVGAFALFGISIQIFMPYLILYYEQSLGMENYVLIMAPAILLAAAATAGFGRAYDMLGFRKAVVPTVLCLMLGYVLLFFGRSTLPVFLGSLFMMTGYLTGMAAFGAIIKDRIPADKAGLFQGIRIIGQVLIPGIIGPAIGAAVLHDAAVVTNSDGTTSFIPDSRIFLAAFLAAAVLLVALAGLFTMMRRGHRNLLTESGEAVKAADAPAWEEYPRPQLRRDSYLCLNGTWQLNGRAIEVPFAPQAYLSGYKGHIGTHLCYTRTFTLPQGFAAGGKKVLLHFGAVDQVADVSVNGQAVAHHEGGYLPFTADITAAVHTEGENTLTVNAIDTLSHAYPYGKQRKLRGGMWYTPVSGIWQTVWLEAVPEAHIESVRFTPDLSGVTLEVKTAAPAFTVTVDLGDGTQLTQHCTEKTVRLVLAGGTHTPHLWTPDDPHLYPVTIETQTDRVTSYFALRTITSEQINGVPRICLNGKPIFLHGVLDQGYYSDGLYLPAAPAEYEADIRRMKALGFNTLRKHIKIEPEAFYAACDRAGMLVLQDMVNSGSYHYVRDTVLPTFGMLSHRDTIGSAGKRKSFFVQHACDTVTGLYNHPCIVGYTIFNEGWGQFESDALYARLKALDSTRFYDSTSGWFAQKQSDVESRHIYFHTETLAANARPLLLSECGGFGLPCAEHCYTKYDSMGYGACTDGADLTKHIDALYRGMVLPAIPKGLCGCIYTQLSDVEDECNGLYTYDRRVCKPEPEAMLALSEDLYAAIKPQKQPATV